MEKSFLSKIIFYLSVPSCVCCGERLDIDDNVLCKKCKREYEELKNRNCSRCAKPLFSCSCSNEFLSTHYVKRLVKVFRYLGHHGYTPGMHLLFSLKKDNREDVLDFLSRELADSIKVSVTNIEEYLVTNVPRRRRAIIKFGIDHSEILAKRIAKIFGIKYKKLLTSKTKRAQKSLEGKERISNAEFDIKDVSIKGQRILLIDDIVTTGASLGSAAALLHSIGAKEIVGATLSIAYKDEYKLNKQ